MNVKLLPCNMYCTISIYQLLTPVSIIVQKKSTVVIIELKIIQVNKNYKNIVIGNEIFQIQLICLIYMYIQLNYIYSLLLIPNDIFIY